MPACAVKTCAARPVFAQVAGSCRQQIQANVQEPMKQHASSEEQAEAPRRRWKPGQEEHPGPENQDSQQMLDQPRDLSVMKFSDSDTQNLENVARGKISPKFHAKFHNTFGSKKRRTISLRASAG